MVTTSATEKEFLKEAKQMLQEIDRCLASRREPLPFVLLRLKEDDLGRESGLAVPLEDFEQFY